MSGIMLNVVGGNFKPAAPTVIGQAFGGGFYAGQIGVSGVATHYLIVAPASSGQNVNQWKNANTATAGADSLIDGPQNTADMVADGNSTVYPQAHFCNDLVIGGFSDWYMPAKNELEVCYYNLKPTTTNNLTNPPAGINPNSVPERTSNYTSGNPAQTTALDFRDTGAEDYSLENHFTSTEFSSANAYIMLPINGFQGDRPKINNHKVRAVRRIPV